MTTINLSTYQLQQLVWHVSICVEQVPILSFPPYQCRFHGLVLAMCPGNLIIYQTAVSYTHLTLPTNREV